MFAAVAADIASEAVQAGPDARRDQVISALNEWRWFWGVDPTRLSAREAIGLFGELWFLIRWAGVSADSVEAWGCLNGARHDFQWPMQSVRSRRHPVAGAVVHTVQHLEQLEDAETGALYLVSLRVARDALAANTLHSLVAFATAELDGQPALPAPSCSPNSANVATPRSAAISQLCRTGLWKRALQGRG